MSTGVERWAELRDREALGESITEHEREECAALESSDPQVRAQAAPYRELSRMLEIASLERPSAVDRNLVDRALSSVRVTSGRAAPGSVDADAEIERAVDPEGPVWIRPTAVAISIFLPAAAAVALMLYEPKPVPTKGPAATQLASKALRPMVVELAHAHTAERGPRLFRSGRVLPSHTELVEGDRVATATSAACLVINPGIDVCLAAGSEVKVVSLSRQARAIEIQRGQAVAHLDTQARGDGFELRAGALRALAQGTVYGLERIADQELRVRVLEGHVKIIASQAQTQLSATQLAIYRNAEQDVTVSVLPAGQTARLWELLATRNAVAEMPTRPASDAAVPTEDASPAPEAVPAIDPSPPADVASAEPTSASKPTRRPPAAPEPPIAAPDARTLLRVAWEQLKAKQWADAAASYATIRSEFSRSDEAHVVLVRLGDLQLDHLDQPAQALASYERYLREGGGPLDAEARFGVVQALARLGRVGAERAAIEDFLAKHPTSLKAVALRERLRSLSR